MGRKRLTRDDVVREALAVLEESGIGAVTLRGVATRMDVHLNSVSFQVTTKARLVELMADAILGELSLTDLPADPEERVTEVVRRFRIALLAHRDGAKLVAGPEVFEKNTLNVAEVTNAALLELGASSVVAARTTWSLHCLILGLVQEEQAAHTGGGYEAAVARYPALAQVGRALLDDSFEERAAFGVEALVRNAVLSSRRAEHAGASAG